MRPITVLRALHWLAVVITCWSLNLLWGIEKATGNGVPTQWERHVVGATLLCGVSALAISIAGRHNRPPGRLALVIETVAAAAALGLGVHIYRKAIAEQMPHLLAGSGWKWMTSGATLAMVTAAASVVVFETQRRRETSSATRKNLKASPSKRR